MAAHSDRANAERPVTAQVITEQEFSAQPVSEQPVTDQQVTEQQVTEQQITEQQITQPPDAAKQFTDQLNTAQLKIDPPVVPLSLRAALLTAQPTSQPASRADPARSLRSAWLGNSNVLAAVWLLGSLLCIALALCMRVGENRRVYFLDWSQPIPETCVAYSRFGIDCPGCGLTRTFVHIAHGELASAWQLSPVGILVFGFACVQIPFGIAQLLFRSRHRLVEAWGKWNDYGIALLVVALLLQWLVRCGERMLT